MGGDGTPVGWSELNARARTLERLGRWDAEAIDVNTRLVVSDPLSVRGYARLGRCHEAMGNFIAAHEMYKHAHEHGLERDPHVGEGLRRVRLRLGVDSSTEIVQSVDDLWALVAIGIRARENRKGTLARAAHEKAVQVAASDDEAATAHTALASTLRSLKRPLEALAHLRESWKHRPGIDANPQAYTSAIAALCDSGNYLDAVLLADQLLAVRPSDPVALRGAIRAYRLLYEATNNGASWTKLVGAMEVLSQCAEAPRWDGSDELRRLRMLFVKRGEADRFNRLLEAIA